MTVFLSKCRVENLRERVRKEIDDLATRKYLRYMPYIPESSVYRRLGEKLKEGEATDQERERFIRRIDRFEKENNYNETKRWAR